MSLDQWKEVLGQYEKLLDKLLLKPSIIICGGEPTISPLFLPILDYIKEKFGDIQVSVLTNGVTITNDFINKTNKYNLTYQVSLDGPNSETHDLVRGKGNFLKAITGISLLRKNNIQVSILAILSKKSSQYLADFFTLAKNCLLYTSPSPRD